MKSPAASAAGWLASAAWWRYCARTGAGGLTREAAITRARACVLFARASRL